MLTSHLPTCINSIIMNFFTSLTDFYNDNILWSPLNLKGMKVVNLINSTTVGCIQHLKEKDALVSLTIYPVSHDPVLLHHLT